MPILDGLRETLSLFGAAVRRALTPTQVYALSGTIGGGRQEVASEYSPERAMSSIAGYPWSRVGVLSVAADLSGLPLVASVGGQRVEGEHWFVRLMKRPDVGWSGVRWRRQVVTDLKSAGNAYARIYRDSAGRPYRLRRIHPDNVSAMTDDGELQAWKLFGREVVSVMDIMHVADVSWRPDPAQSLIGESPVRPLAVSTAAAISARRQAGAAAKRGRLEMLLSAKAAIGQGGLEQVRTQYVESMQSGDGVFVTSHGITAQPMSLSPRDTEWAELDIRTRDETLAVHGVPPVRAQLPSANYGAAKQEMRQYWESSCMRLADLIDAELSYVADPSGQTTIAHSFEKVEALQTSYTERLSRVKMWVDLGASPYRAALHEGFALPPLDVSTEPRSLTPASPPSASQVDTPQARTLEGILPELSAWVDHMLTEGCDADELAPVVQMALADVGIMSDCLAADMTRAAEDAYQSTGVSDCASLLAFDTDTIRRAASMER